MYTQATTSNTPSGRTRDPEGTRARLVECAFHEIHTHGYAGASLDRILASAGVTKGALYHHFKSKADLLHAVIDGAIRPMVIERWLGPLQGADDPISVLAESTRILMEGFSAEEMRSGCPLNNLTQELSGVDEDFRTHLNRVADEWRAGLRDAFLRGQRAGTVRKNVDAAAVASLIFATHQGLAGTVKTSMDQDAVLAGLGVFVELLEGLRP
jgi:TetR/AcrR family transcriptional regulator, transcriptional repressor for nem operon